MALFKFPNSLCIICLVLAQQLRVKLWSERLTVEVDSSNNSVDLNSFDEGFNAWKTLASDNGTRILRGERIRGQIYYYNFEAKKTTDNVDIGDIDTVANEFIVVREGVANVRLYYIPKTYINNYDGSSLYVAVPSGLVSAKFERETEPTPEEIRMLGEEKPKKVAEN